jgi:hypothetical protein
VSFTVVVMMFACTAAIATQMLAHVVMHHSILVKNILNFELLLDDWTQLFVSHVTKFWKK